MSDLEDKNKHISAKTKSAAPTVSGTGKKPQPLTSFYTEDDDFSELEQRFSDHGRNKYYAKVSAGYRNVKLILVMVLTAVVALALVLGADSFTYSNLRYLLRNFGEANYGNNERALCVEFHGADGIELDVYGGKLVVAQPDKISLYRMSGKSIYEIGTDVASPLITCGEKYFFIWECGSPSVSLFNSVSRVGEITADGSVYAVSADKHGSFAILYKDRVYSSSVAVYDADMQKRATKNMPHDNAVDLALSHDGRFLYTLSFTTKDGDYLTKLDFSDINSGTVVHTYTYSGEFPLKVGSFSDGGCYAVTDSALYVYSADGELLYGKKTASSVLSVFSDDSYVSTVTSEKGRASLVTVVSQAGEAVASVSLDGAVIDGCITENGLFLLSSSVVLVSLEDGSKQLISRAPNALTLLTDNGAVYCVYTGKAELIFSDGMPVNTAANDQVAVNN